MLCRSLPLIALACLVASPAAAEEGWPAVPVAEQIAVAPAEDWVRATLILADGDRRRGYVQRGDGEVRYKRMSTHDPEAIPVAGLEAIEYRPPRNRYSREADRRFRKGNHAGALEALRMAPEELRSEPGMALKLILKDRARHRLPFPLPQR